MTPEAKGYFCSECGQATASEELIRFGERMVCPNCKDTFTQKLREGVAPAAYVEYAGFWLRFVATIIDSIILAIPMGILQAVVLGAAGLSLAGIDPDPNATPEQALRMIGPLFAAIGFSALIGFALGAVYEATFIAKLGATPGKMAIGVKVLRPDGSMVGFGRALGRYFSKILSAMILYIGYIMAGFDAEKRALHDMICDTRVIKNRR